jgi:uncharacterized protein YjiK
VAAISSLPALEASYRELDDVAKALEVSDARCLPLFIIIHVLTSQFYLYSQTVEIEQERKRAEMAAEVEARIDAGKVEAVQAYKVSHLSCNAHGR